MDVISVDVADLYSEKIATRAAGVLSMIDRGDFASARRDIENLLSGDDCRLARQHLLFVLSLKQGRIEQAEACFQTCLEEQPDLYLAEYCQRMLVSNFPDRAMALLERQAQDASRQPLVLAVLEYLIDRNARQGPMLPFRNLTIGILRVTGQFDAAVSTSIAMPDQRFATIVEVLSDLSRANALGYKGSVTFSEPLEKEIVRMLEAESVYTRPLARIFYGALERKIQRWENEEATLGVLSHDALFIAMLSNMELASVELEMYLTRLRKRVLQETMEIAGGQVSYLDLIFGLVIQCEQTEYAYFMEQEEGELLGRLEVDIREQLGGSDPDPVRMLVPILLMLMYRSPIELEFAAQLTTLRLGDVYPPLATFICSLQESHAAEMALAEEFAHAAALRDDTSARVAGMYEANPYPRWNGIAPSINPAAQPVAEFYGLQRAPAWRADVVPDIESVLVAGCGSGLHPITVATGFPWLQVTAIDITCRSLAYAKIRADERGIENIRFLRGDILQLADWSDRFDLVESVGVIHHMEDPEAGLRGLLSVLRPGGLLKLGVYSRPAREAVIRFREQNAGRFGELRADDIRRIRHELLTSGDDRFRDLMYTPEFFSMSGCRDLMLHEQESQFTLPQLMSMLEDNGLQFLCFTPQGKIYEQLRALLGPDVDPYDWRNWQQAESKFPSLFAGMYTVIAQLA